MSGVQFKDGLDSITVQPISLPAPVAPVRVAVLEAKHHAPVDDTRTLNGAIMSAGPAFKSIEEGVLPMVLFEGIEREHVLRAIQECVDIGNSDFLKKYGYGKAIRYVLLEDKFEKGGRYASKAILGVARKYARPELGALRNSEFSGGMGESVKKLEELGFRVDDTTKPAGKGSSLGACAVENLRGTMHHFWQVFIGDYGTTRHAIVNSSTKSPLMHHFECSHWFYGPSS